MHDSSFFRFPHTPHLGWLAGGCPRSDKLLSQAEADKLLSQPVTVEEKLDGSNLGISIDSGGNFLIQNRGQYLHPPYVGQFSRLQSWLAKNTDALYSSLDRHLLIFGEWCAARHSLEYDNLPDWWLAFDVYDRSAERFWSASRRNALMVSHGLHTVPTLGQGHFTLNDLAQIVSDHSSRFRRGLLEGVVVRQDGADWAESRAKLVRADFVQSIGDHWRNRSLEWNRVISAP
jgi:ATP-dependent RNA circularization protein (DNA/RNA ligase family)